MKVDFLADIIEFHEKFELHYQGKPRALQSDLADFRLRFMQEELNEWDMSMMVLIDEVSKAPEYRDKEVIERHLELSLDALVDLLYVLMGTAYLQGFFPVFEEAWTRVHKANMSKVRRIRGNGTEQDSGRAPQFDIVKPADFVAPSHIDLVVSNVHNTNVA